MEATVQALTKQRDAEARKAKASAAAAAGAAKTKGMFKGKVVERTEVPRRRRAPLVSQSTGILSVLLEARWPARLFDLGRHADNGQVAQSNLAR